MKNSKAFIILSILWLMVGVFYSPLIAQPPVCTNSPTDLGVVPEANGGNPALCEGGVRIDPVPSGTSNVYYTDAYGNTYLIAIIYVESTDCGEVFEWTVAQGIVIDSIVAKGGSGGYNLYDYTSLNPDPTSDGNLHAPLNPNGKYADLSHIDFCFHYKLTVGKTANAEFTRTYAWGIDKACLGGDLTLSVGQAFNYPFQWTASVYDTDDSDFKVTGVITIYNDSPFPATITSVSDVLSSGQTAVLDLNGIVFPYVLARQESLVIPYMASLPSALDGTNTATVTTSSPLVEGNTATADYYFGMPTTEVDDCVTVTDDCMGSSYVCYNEAPYTSNYYCYIGPYDVCGSYTYTNTASFTTNTTGTGGSDDCTVSIEVPCNGGCTLTQGYWKTHSEFGPAPYDGTWALLSNGASTPFFLSGKTWYQVFWTPPAGNAYYNLAHQYMAARLNYINGAGTNSAVDLALQWAETQFFNLYTPANWPNSKRKTALAYATTLDRYNNGLIGPGHCSEDESGNYRPSKTAMNDRDNHQAELESTPEMFVFPNPATDQIFIDLSRFAPAEDLSLRIFNTGGQLCQEQFLGGHGGEIISLGLKTTLPPGQYVVVLQHTNGMEQTVLTVLRQ